MKLCDAPLLNLNESWYTDRPVVGVCFQQTILSWIPLAVALLSLPAFIYTTVTANRAPATRLKLTLWLAVKWALQLVLLANLLLLLVYTALNPQPDPDDVSGVQSTPLACQLQGVVTRLLAVVLINFLTGICYTQAIITSGTIFLTLLALALCAGPQLEYQILMDSSLLSYTFITCCIHISTSLILCFMYCFVDRRLTPAHKKQDYGASYKESMEFQPLQDKGEVSKEPNPELSSSFLNRLVYWYFNRFSWKGFKKPLDTEDLWLLNVEDRLKSLIKIWKNKWPGFASEPAPEFVTVPTTISGKVASDENINGALHEENGIMRSLSESKPSKPKEKAAEKKSSVIWTILRIHWATILGGCVLQLGAIVFLFIKPQILNWLILIVEEPTEKEWHGYVLTGLLFVVQIVWSVFTAGQTFLLQKIGLRASAVLTGAVFEKSLLLNSESRQAKSVGQIVNLMSVDVANFQPISWFLMLVWASPLKLFIGFYMLWGLLDTAMLAGFVVIVFVMIPAFFMIRLLQRWQKEQMALKDERLRLMSEILNGIKVFKLYAWELSLQKMVMDIREREVDVIRKISYIIVFGTAIIYSLPFLIAASSFFAYVYLLGRPLTPQVAFVSLSLFNILRMPMLELPMMLAFAIQLFVSNNRLSKFLNAEELSYDSIERHDSDAPDGMSVVLHNISAHWGAAPPADQKQDDGKDKPKRLTRKEKKAKKAAEEAAKLIPVAPILKDLNVQVHRGKLVAVVGRVGMGKTTLLNTILGETVITSGHIRAAGSMAYVAQLPWIQNASVRDNVLFGSELQTNRYEHVIKACALTADLDMLPAGDKTEIGERGINLSGGQKQRVAIARAVYQDSDTYLLDDPLSAVDTHVGQHIFEQVIGANGLLAGKTRILVTHQLLCLPHVDIIHVVKDGCIAESGTYDELLNSGSGEFRKVLEEMKKSETGEDPFKDEHTESVTESLPASPTEEAETDWPILRKRLSTTLSSGSGAVVAPVKPPEKVVDDAGKLVDDEEAATGKVHWRVYLLYFQSLGILITVFWMLFYVLAAAFGGFENFFLSYWSNQSQNLTVNSNFSRTEQLIPISIYTGIGVVQSFWVLMATGTQVWGSLNASRTLHHNLIRAIFRAPLQFFDVTPVGRILNRAGRDLNSIDFQIPTVIRTWWVMLMGVFLVISVILISTPAFGVVVVPLGLAYIALTLFYIRTSRQLVRLQAVTKSPVYQHFQEALQGVSTIRAFGSGERFIVESQKRVDLNNACYYPNLTASAWLTVRLELIGNLATVFAAVFALLYSASGKISAGELGLSITYAMSVTGALGALVQFSSALEQQIVSVERVKDYTGTEPEAEWNSEKPPPEEWPTKGQIVFRNVGVRYREGLDKVLDGISVHVQGGQRIGIVGRTGAGKSSLTLALFRLVEICEGSIEIDGLNIADIGLHELRSRLTIIPQDPVLFCASVRDNLDPLHEYDDARLWQALEHAHLKHTIEALKLKLDHKIVEGGDNLSVGQRQLMCLARALLRHSRILVLDEATAACDLQTDALIQQTIKTEFSSCTVLTIAHRLNTIMDSHKVLVLEQGRVAEFDSPARLLQNTKSVFYSMVNAQDYTS